MGALGEKELQAIGSTESAATETIAVLALRVRIYLSQIAGSETPITYQSLAKAVGISPPNTIHQLTLALECLIEQDVAAARPLIATLVVSKARRGLPAPGFFDCARRFGRFNGDLSGPESSTFYTQEFNRAVEFWSKVDEVSKADAKLRQPP